MSQNAANANLLDI